MPAIRMSIVIGAIPTVFAVALAQALAAPVLQPHSASYQFKLVAARSGGSVTDASGMMTFDLSDACRGWASEQKTTLRLGFTSGEQVSFGWKTSSFETKDGLEYRFFVENFSDLTGDESQSGRARLEADGSGGMAEITEKGETRERELPAGASFPSALTVKLIEAAKAGEVILVGPLFDGSGDSGVYDVSLVIGKPLPAGAPVPFAALEGLASWHVRAAFYDLGASGSVPDQEQAFRLFENGVVDKLKLDLGEFVVEGSLTDYEELPAGGC